MIAEKKRKKFRILLIIGFGVFILIVVFTSTKIYANRNFSKFLLSQKGHLKILHEKLIESDERVQICETEIGDDKGTRIGFLLQKPVNSKKRLPAVVILGGIDIGKETLSYMDEEGSVLIVAMGYPYDLSKVQSFWSAVKEIPAIREAVFKTVAGTLLVMDYLRERTDLDTNRVTLVGYSFGAPFVPCIMSLDKRYKAAALLYGGGDLEFLIGNYLQENFGIFSKLLGKIAAFLIRPIEPLLYIQDISPSPFVMIQGTEDPFFPAENAKKLFDKSREPKDLIWIESSHMAPWKKDLLKKIISTLRDWMIKNDLL
ncbi:MAG: alpha/beta hydrolase family protein [bacterium]